MEAGLRGKVTAALERLAAEELSEDETEEALAALRGFGEWPAVREALLSVLREGRLALWPEAVRVVFLLRGRGCAFEADPTIALLNDCLTLCDELDANLVWTITKDLKGLSYLSDYEPYDDEAVMREMELVRRGRAALGATPPSRKSSK